MNVHETPMNIQEKDKNVYTWTWFSSYFLLRAAYSGHSDSTPDSERSVDQPFDLLYLWIETAIQVV